MTTLTIFQEGFTGALIFGSLYGANALIKRWPLSDDRHLPVTWANNIPMYVGAHYILQFGSKPYTAEFRGRAGDRYLFFFDNRSRFVYEHEIRAAVGVPAEVAC